MINIKTECKDCRHDHVCKYKEDWTKQAETWRADKNKETLVSDNIMIATLECRIFSPPTCTTKSIKKNTEENWMRYDGWGL